MVVHPLAGIVLTIWSFNAPEVALSRMAHTPRLHRVQSRLLGCRFDLFGGRPPGRVGVMEKASVEIRPVDDCRPLADRTVIVCGRQFTPSPVVRLCCLERLLREKRVVFDQIVSLDSLSTEVSACQEHIRPGADGSGARLGCLFC